MARIINLANLQQFTAVNALSTDLGNIPGPVVIPQCAQIVINWSLADGKIAHNVLNGRYAGSFAGTQSQANAIMTALTTGGPATAFLATISTAASITGVTLRNVAVVDQPLITSSNAAVPGTAAGFQVPSEMAIVVTLRTALVGRANRGRMYVPGFISAGTLAASDVVAAATITALQNWANTIVGALSGSGYTLVIGQRARAAYTSPVTGRVFPARPANTVPVTSLVVRDNHWDSQRRRGLR